MSPPRTAHCEDVIRLLEECHARPFFHRALGVCNDAKVQVNKCLRDARGDRSAANRAKAKAKRVETEALWKEIDMNS